MGQAEPRHQPNTNNKQEAEESSKRAQREKGRGPGNKKARAQHQKPSKSNKPVLAGTAGSTRKAKATQNAIPTDRQWSRATDPAALQGHSVSKNTHKSKPQGKPHGAPSYPCPPAPPYAPSGQGTPEANQNQTSVHTGAWCNTCTRRHPPDHITLPCSSNQPCLCRLPCLAGIGLSSSRSLSYYACETLDAGVPCFSFVHTAALFLLLRLGDGDIPPRPLLCSDSFQVSKVRKVMMLIF